MTRTSAPIPCHERECGRPGHRHDPELVGWFASDLKQAAKGRLDAIGGSHCARIALAQVCVDSLEQKIGKTRPNLLLSHDKAQQQIHALQKNRNKAKHIINTIKQADRAEEHLICGSSSHSNIQLTYIDGHVFSPERSSLIREQNQEIKELLFCGGKPSNSMPKNPCRNFDKVKAIFEEARGFATNCEMEELAQAAHFAIAHMKSVCEKIISQATKSPAKGYEGLLSQYDIFKKELFSSQTTQTFDPSPDRYMMSGALSGPDIPAVSARNFA